MIVTETLTIRFAESAGVNTVECALLIGIFIGNTYNIIFTELRLTGLATQFNLVRRGPKNLMNVVLPTNNFVIDNVECSHMGKDLLLL